MNTALISTQPDGRETRVVDPFFTVSAGDHIIPRGFDRLVMRLSMATLTWAHNRADRGAASQARASRDSQSRRQANLFYREHRERVTTLMAFRQR